MYHIILIAIVFTISLGVWNLVHAAPRSIVLFLPERVAFIAGTFWLIFGMFFAFISAYPLQNGPAMIAFFLQAYVGLWFLLAHLRGDELFLRRAFLMMGTMVLTIIAVYYVQDPRAIAALSLLLVTAGYWLTVKYLHFLDTGR